MAKTHTTETRFTFPTSRRAWDFYRSIGYGVGAVAGYPSLSAPYTVRTRCDDGLDDELADEAARFEGKA